MAHLGDEGSEAETSDEGIPIDWPKDGDKLLVQPEPPFYLPDTYSVRRRTDAERNYAAGYKKAAGIILHELQETCSELLVFPFISLWRHHIELALKNLIMVISQSKGNSIAMEGHNLPALWNAVDRLTTDDQKEHEELRKSFSATKDIIKELEKLDSEGQGARYANPRHPRKQHDDRPTWLVDNLRILPRHFDFNHFAQTLMKVSFMIECLSMEYSNRVSDTE